MSTSLNQEAEVLSRLELSLGPAGAKDVLSIRFSDHDNDRIIELLEKRNRGTRTADEDREAQEFERVGHLISMLKSVARRTLKQS